MSQNTSSAVMAQRVEPPDSLDFFPTPPWATRALCEWLRRQTSPSTSSCWEPACGDGAMVRPLAEYFVYVEATDCHDYGCGYEVRDFLFPSYFSCDWIITNPPFRLGCDFALTAIQRARVGVAMLVRTAFLESVGRYERLFRDHPPAVLQFTERVPMFRGRLDAKGSTATAYCWLIWHGPRPGSMHWIPPCRKALERPRDYEAPS